jgi:hypothetical protein
MTFARDVDLSPFSEVALSANEYGVMFGVAGRQQAIRDFRPRAAGHEGTQRGRRAIGHLMWLSTSTA